MLACMMHDHLPVSSDFSNILNRYVLYVYGIYIQQTISLRLQIVASCDFDTCGMITAME